MRAQTGALPNPFTFTAREGSEIGLGFYRARYYQPLIGRFLQEDPDGYKWGINLFNYANGNPVKFKDPSGFRACASGRCPDCPGGTWVSTAGVAEGGVHLGPIEVGGVVFAGVFVCLSNPTFSVPWITVCGYGSGGRASRGVATKAVKPTAGGAFGVGAAGVTCFGYSCKEDLAGPEAGGFVQVGPVFGFGEGNITGGHGCVGAGATAGGGIFGGGFGCKTYIH